MKKFNKGFLFGICLGLILVTGLSIGGRIVPSIPPELDPNNNADKSVPVEDIQRFATVIAQIKQFYIEPVSDKTLFNNAIRGMLTNLDPHSSFLDTDDLRDLKTVTTGEFGGIGVEVMPENGFMKVISPLDDTPAAKVGIKAGDLIVRIDNKLVKNMTIEQAINLIRGKKGTQVSLTIIRKSETKPLNLKLTREIVKVQAVKSKLLENGYGVIRIAFFQANAKNEVEKAIKNLQQQSGGNLKGIILDLRNDPGGLLDAAIDVTNEFLDPDKLKGDKLIVYTKGRMLNQDIKAKASSHDILHGLPMVVLINQGSASASEIVAGALQDYKRALIVGTKSFGKGSVQTVIPIDNQSAIKLTTALYYTPSGRSIQAKGIEPDVVIPDLKIQKPSNQEALLVPIEEADLDHHLDNGNKKNSEEKQDKEDKGDKGDKSENKNSSINSNNNEKPEQEATDQKTEKLLAHDDYQLYEALNLLKGLSASRTIR